jgi:hypothetical protein
MITSLCPDSTVLDGITLHAEENDYGEDITTWLNDLGMTD